MMQRVIECSLPNGYMPILSHENEKKKKRYYKERTRRKMNARMYLLYYAAQGKGSCKRFTKVEVTQPNAYLIVC